MGLRPLARRVIAALLLVLLTACHSWRPTTVSPQQLIPEEQPSLVRVTLIDGETVTVRDPTRSSPDLCVKAEEAPRLRLGCLGDLLFLEVKSRFVCKSGGSSSPSARLLGRPPVSGGVRGRGNAGRPRRVWS